MTTIPVVVHSDAGDLQPGTLSPSTPPRTVNLDVEQLRQSITTLTGEIATLFQDIKTVGDYKLREVEVSLEVGAEGGVALIGKFTASTRGAITLTFAPD